MMSVSSLNTKIKSLLEATFMHTMVEGEVASATYHTSGHLYFSIKDKDSSIKCVMWRSAVTKMKFRIEKGMHIIVEGSVSVYTPRGEYQFQTVRIEPYGQGTLALAYEQLKERLKAKGYFENERKKAIPKYISKIALVAAKDSAALHDMLKIIEKRWPMLEVFIMDTLVQGEQASKQIARSLAYADTLGMDVIVVGRGGGSAEDLWAFNEEVVADAIFAMKTPVVSAVGHEVDVLISDFVSDLRAPTPSAAMEMILPDMREIHYALDEIYEQFSYVISQLLGQLQSSLRHMEALLLRSAPTIKLVELEESFKRLKEEGQRVIQFIFKQRQEQCLNLHKTLILYDPKIRCKEGWAEVLMQGKRVSLDALECNKIFVLEDADTKIEALCKKKTHYS
ncbi:MAG: exodeoxyribonuclease VII large subunit [Epsilonproteobacteria bacterium]|nr:MAG: exodeoxyribonuclease VII large subunit [Campylobacterota bacterium]